MLALFVRRDLMDVETAHGMLAWPHSGFHVHDEVRLERVGRKFLFRIFELEVSMAAPTVATHIVDSLAAAGVQRIYGVVGDSLNGLTEVSGPRSLKTFPALTNGVLPPATIATRCSLIGLPFPPNTVREACAA